MGETEYRVGKCSQCGEELRIPAQLAQFSCMYCGAKLTPADLVTAVTPLDMDGDAAQLMARVKRDLICCMTDHVGIQKSISRSEYDPTFDKLEADCRPVFEDLDTACRLDPAGRAAMLDTAVTCFLDDLERHWEQNPKWKIKARRTALRDDDKMVIAIFLVPMVMHLKLGISREFCELLQKKWLERFPKSPFFVGSYEDISSGFRKRFKFCFITTAVCEELGKPDDCAELTAFRTFRDGYLAGCPDGKALIDEYYEIAPGIVTCINHCGDRTARYTAIRDTYLQPCFEALQANEPALCKERYVRMVRALQKQYLS